MAKDLLFEIGTEELPANFIEGVRGDFQDLAKEVFSKNRLKFAGCRVFSTPRRLTLYVQKMEERQRDKKESVKGPAQTIAFDEKGDPTKAALGFARGQGVDIDDLIIRDGYLFVDKLEKGQRSEKLLTTILPLLIKRLSLPKAMRWGNYDLRFIRPIKWMVALFGEDLIKFSMAGVNTGKESYGHRFLTKGTIKINRPSEYFTKLEKGFVIVDQLRRKEMILKQIDEIKMNLGQVLLDENLLSEVVDLLEYPTVFFGRFDQEYLKLPHEVLISSMIEHQRYFPVVDQENNLLAYFIAVRDGIETYIDEVRYGNEMVLRARLADARFFFEEDLKEKISKRQEKLKNIVYQEKLGSMFDKVERMRKLAKKIALGLNLAEEDLKIIDRAAELSKNDLITEMVNEFSKLQGVMGREYAILNGEKKEVAWAIFEQYLPRFAGDKLPETIYGQVISLTDKIDNIVSHFSLGLIPTGSKDPFALRRQATGLIKIVLQSNLKLQLSDLINWGLEVLNLEGQDIYLEIKEFLLQRVNNLLSENGVRYDIIKAVIKAGDDDLNDILARAEAIMELRKENPELFIDLIRGLVRAKNLVGKTKEIYKIKQEYIKEDAEKRLYNSYLEVKDIINNLFHQGQYLEGLKKLVGLKEPIDNFLDNLIVMADDEIIKNNRLALLQGISKLIKPVIAIEEIALDD